jgi:hypothetical protein
LGFLSYLLHTFEKALSPCAESWMELAWNCAHFGGTPAPGMRRENLNLDEALRNLPVEESENEKPD